MESKKQITAQDVINVANNLGMTLDAHQLNFVLQYYTDSPSDIIENLLYEYEYHTANKESKN
jgi:hypothetical protein